MGKASPANIGVLGAGIMGCCLALELARRGEKSDLIDLASMPITGASLHNEGKLHLGFVYANDPSQQTYKLMLRGSLTFGPIIQVLTGCSVGDMAPSQPFQYYVPNDSQLDMDTIHQHFQKVEEAIQKEIQCSDNLYLGRKFDRYYERNSPKRHESIFSPSSTLGSFHTEERSVSPIMVAELFRRAIANHPRINFIGRTKVVAAERRADGHVDVVLRQANRTVTTRYGCVANALWDDKVRIDRTAGIPDPGPWIMRYKATINIAGRTAANDDIPSATGILGPYGDVVNHHDGSYYISWYPLTKVAQSIDDAGRELHDRVHQNLFARTVRKMVRWSLPVSRFVASHAHRHFVDDNIREMAAFIPALRGLQKGNRKFEVGGGVILARGETDIDDPNSFLHQRSVIGPSAYGSYITIDTGKYCTAPLFSIHAADMITRIV